MAKQILITRRPPKRPQDERIGTWPEDPRFPTAP